VIQELCTFIEQQPKFEARFATFKHAVHANLFSPPFRTVTLHFVLYSVYCNYLLMLDEGDFTVFGSGSAAFTL